MTKRILIPCVIVACAFTSLAGALESSEQNRQHQTPTCQQSLDSLDARVRRNYAGFLLEIKGARRRDYELMLRQALSRAANTPLESCFGVLSGYTDWFQDPHLFVFQSQNVEWATAAQRALSLAH